MKKFLAVAAIALLLTGCAESGTKPAAGEDSINTQTAEDAKERIRLPDGYPQVVEVADLPDRIRPSFEYSGFPQAVAVADGVWAELPPGASVDDAVNAKTYKGYCASVEAFKKNYLDGEARGITCW